MNDISDNVVIVSFVTCVGVVTIVGAFFIYRHSLAAEQTERACIAAGGEVIKGDCVRRTK